MYYPYVRGKQYELVLMKEQAELMGKNGKITPIIEPVKENLNPLNRSLQELIKNNVQFVLIANPFYGDFSKDSENLLNFILKIDKEAFVVGLIVSEKSTLEDLRSNLNRFNDYTVAIIHQGFSHGKELAELLSTYTNIRSNIFVSQEPNKLYQKHFKGIGQRILIRDGFKKQKNASYPFNEHFSDLHITYEEENVDGFGDFMIVGNDYSESGGPAWAVAIHMTYLDADQNMFTRHYVSDRQDDNKDAGGKFLEALKYLVEDEKKNKLFQTNASNEYLELYKKELFRGLGYAKKLSMQNHLEVIARFLESQNG
jgi:hypothetical protein